ncbi:MAG: metal-dependent hydrolase [Clostridia bacterium]|nr:metal-dependent hydrolase [Clostridia bacterium]
MDPVTHAVIGMSVAKLTGHQIALSDPATLGLVIGSVFPDVDIIFHKWGDHVYHKNHRALTHSGIGIAISSVMITFALGRMFPASNLYTLFLWTLLGCISHTAFDVLNSYGTRFLWPFVKKKFSLNLLTVVDPLFVFILLGYVLGKGTFQNLSLAALAVYLGIRLVTRRMAMAYLKKEFGSKVRRVYILPSINGFFRWHFIIEAENQNIIGEKSMLSRKIKIIKTFPKVKGKVLNKAVGTPVGKFFSEFSPLFNISCEEVGDVTRYTFTDMRYYISDNFLHHAVLELDEDDNILKSSFNPYSMNRNCDIA